MPFGLATAKGAFYILLKNRGKGLDAFGTPFGWDELESRNFSLLPDQPHMRSAPRDGVERPWAIPTIVIASHRFFYKAKRKTSDGLPPLREVYEWYGRRCCFCGEIIKHISDASREHVHSRALGGEHTDNIALAHKLCNSLAGHAMPKLDKDGNVIVPKMRVFRSGFVLPSHVEPRPEWRLLLHLEDHKPESFGSVRSEPLHTP